MRLYELNLLVRQTLKRELPGYFWVEAELSEVHENGGHCYMELVEKGPDGNTPIARASARCWRSTWEVQRPKFVSLTGQAPAAGMKVLMKVYGQFHEAYGFSWIVTDIDPTYTLGDMAAKRRQIIETLRREGVIDLNRSLPMPLFAQSIAVVTSSNAAGYDDFCRQLEENEHGFNFVVTPFWATMQGNAVEPEIINSLDEIAVRSHRFDCVVIVRGGGATSDLSGFDSLALAEHVANFPLPVITGIGHNRDECVIDLVAHTHVKTPTAAAVLLISNLKRTADRIDEAERRIALSVKGRLERERLRLARLSEGLNTRFALTKEQREGRLRLLGERIKAAMATRLERSAHRLDLLSQRIEAQDPALLLRRGYSITTVGGKAVRDAAALRPGDVVETRLEKGKVKSTVTETL